MLKRIDKNETEQLREYLDSRMQEISSDVLLRTNEILLDVRKNGDAKAVLLDEVDVTGFFVGGTAV